jgi:hypothetical protein
LEKIMPKVRVALLTLAAGIGLGAIVDAASAQTCPIDLANPIRIPKKANDPNDRVKHAYRLPDGSIVFLGRFTIDADGAPHAYNPSNTGLDHIGNAGSPGNWWALATNASQCGPTGTPVLQANDDPAPGFYVAKTTMENPTFGCRKQRRYVNSETISYVALPPVVARVLNNQGRLAVVQGGFNTGFAVHADQAPKFGVGEGSMELARTLGLNPNPRTGGTNVRELLFLVLPQSMGFPPDNAAVQTAARTAFEAWGGSAKLTACRAAVESAPR